MLKMKLQHLGHLMWRANSLEDTLMLGNFVGRRRGVKRMKWWFGITHSMDVILRKLCKTVKAREAYSVSVHVITRNLTWLSNWTIPMRTEGPVKPVALVGVGKDLGERGGFPSSGAGPWIQDKEYRILNVTKHCFLKTKTKTKQKNVFCRSENFDWVCSLDFTEEYRRNMEWGESAKTRWLAAEVQGMW